MAHKDHIHHKVSKDSTLCGGSVFGVLTNAEGRVVDCPGCLERLAPRQVTFECIKEPNTQPFLKVSVGGELFAEVYPCEVAWKLEDGKLSLDQLPDWFKQFYQQAVQQPGIKNYLED